MTKPNISRRKILVGLGATGIASLAGIGIGTRRSLGFTTTETIESEGYHFVVDWRETYNGEILEDTRSVEFEPEGAIVSLPNVVPGDVGTVSFRIGVESDDDELEVEPEFGLALQARTENSSTEPEETAGDDTPDEGELQDFLSTLVWIDEGLANYDVLGGENAEFDTGETELAGGTFEDVTPLEVALGECLAADGEETVTVSLRWEFDPDVDSRPVNVTQSDGITFDIGIGGEVCE